MARKKRSFVQGSIKRIYDLFFKEMVRRYKPEDISVITFLENLFDVDYRFIDLYKVRHTFNIPGLLYTAGSVKTQGIGNRIVKEGSVVFVRLDARQNTYDIECQNGVGQKEQVFQLSNSEWNSIAAHLEKIDS